MLKLLSDLNLTSQPLSLNIHAVLLYPLLIAAGILFICLIRFASSFHKKELRMESLKGKKIHLSSLFLLMRMRFIQFFSCIFKRHAFKKDFNSKEISLQDNLVFLEIPPETSKHEETIVQSTSYEVRPASPIIMPEEAPNIFKPGELTVDKLNEDLEPFGFAYSPYNDIFYSVMDGWQRDCGYCQLYDEACPPLSMIIDSEPIYFEYAGKRWLIEFWKGQYGMNTGAEIGVYTTTGPDISVPGVFNGTFYYCASNEDHLILGFRLKKFGKILAQRRQLHWWLTCFVLGEFSHPSNLIMDCEVTFKDNAMRDAFLGGMYRAGYHKRQLTIRGNTVSFEYDKPKSRQPITRNAITEFIMQTNNNRNCKAYNEATIGYTNSLDKINFIKHQAPKIYKKILNVGSTKETFELFDLVKSHLELPERPFDIYHTELPLSGSNTKEGKEETENV